MAQVHDIVAAPDSRPYELLLEIGSGGMADVFLGRAVGAGGFERHVAVKVCHVRLAKDPAFRAMFLDEARLAARIHHRNVVGMLDVGAEKELFLVMEYVEGASFTELVELAERRGERMPVDVVLRVLVDLLAGLHAAHETTSADGQNLGIVHRDVSGQNILVGADGASRILDFGVAKALARSATTKEGQVKGKIAYMPPEYLHTREVGRFTDVYSAAVVAWEALAGCSLFMGETEGQTVASVMRAQVPSLRDVRPEVSEAVEKVLRRAMNRDWRQRFATAAEFSGALEAAGAPIATHDRVGAFVQTVAGASLEERRQRVRASERNTPLGLPLQARAAASDSVASEPSTVTPRRVGARAVGAGVAMLLAALALVLWWNAARTPPEDSPSEAGAVVPEAGPAANVEPVRGADDRRAPIDPDSVEATPSAAGDSTGVDAGDVAAKPAQNAVSSPVAVAGPNPNRAPKRRRNGCRATSEAVLAASLLLLTCAGPVAADDAPMDAAEGGTSLAADAREARGREESNRGKAFYVAGNHADALTAFRASIEAYPSATAYLLAARCLRAMGRLGEAVVEYEHAVILGGTHASENAEYAKTSQVAADELAELARKVARVRLHVTPADAHAAVRVAGRAIPDDARERAWPVTPGTVRVEAFAEGFAPFETELVVRAGDEVPVEINLSRAPGEAGGAPVPSDTTPAAIVADGIDADASPGRPPWGAFAWASVGLAAVGAAAFTAFYILADGQRDDYRAACVVAPCSDAKQRDLSSTGTTYQTLTNIGLAVGIAGAALALTFFLLDMDADEARAHEASLVPEVDGAGVRWRF